MVPASSTILTMRIDGAKVGVSVGVTDPVILLPVPLRCLRTPAGSAQQHSNVRGDPSMSDSPSQWPMAQGNAPYQPAPVVLPSLVPTVLITLFFGIFGLIPAAMGASKAQAAGMDGSRYWKAFGLVLVIEVIIGILLWVLVGSVLMMAC